MVSGNQTQTSEEMIQNVCEMIGKKPPWSWFKNYLKFPIFRVERRKNNSQMTALLSVILPHYVIVDRE